MTLVFKMSVVVGLFALGTNGGVISRFLFDFKRSADIPVSAVDENAGQFDVTEALAEISRLMDDLLKSYRNMEPAELERIKTHGILTPKQIQLGDKVEQIKSQVASRGSSYDRSVFDTALKIMTEDYSKAIMRILSPSIHVENTTLQSTDNVKDVPVSAVYADTDKLDVAKILADLRRQVDDVLKSFQDMGHAELEKMLTNDDLTPDYQQLRDNIEQIRFQTASRLSPDERAVLVVGLAKLWKYYLKSVKRLQEPPNHVENTTLQSTANVSDDNEPGEIGSTLVEDGIKVVNARLNNIENRVESLEEDVNMLKQEERGPSTQKMGIGCPEGFVQNDHLGRCYLFSSEPATITDALSACSDLYNSGLVAIETKEEDDFLVNIIADKYGDEDFFTGGYKHGDIFLWSQTRDQIRYFNWGPGQPSNDRSRSHEGCLEIKYYWGYGQHYWNDLPCTYRKRFICERDMDRSDDIPVSAVDEDAGQFDVTEALAAIIRQMDDLLKSYRNMEPAELERIKTHGILTPKQIQLGDKVEQIKSQVASRGSSYDRSVFDTALKIMTEDYSKAIMRILSPSVHVENNALQSTDNVKDVHVSAVYADTDKLDVAKILADLRRQVDDVLERLQDMGHAELEKLLTTDGSKAEFKQLDDKVEQIRFLLASRISPDDRAVLVVGLATSSEYFQKSLKRIRQPPNHVENTTLKSTENVKDVPVSVVQDDTDKLDVAKILADVRRQVDDVLERLQYMGHAELERRITAGELTPEIIQLHYDVQHIKSQVARKLSSDDRLVLTTGLAKLAEYFQMSLNSIRQPPIHVENTTLQSTDNVSDDNEPGEIGSTLVEDGIEVVNTRLNDVENRVESFEEDVNMLKQRERGPSTQKMSTGCPEGFVQNDHLGRCYLFSSEPATITDAKSTCSDLYNAGLVDIETKEEDDFLVNIIADKYGDEDFLTGGYKYGDIFVWSQTNDQIRYFNWGPGEPSNDRRSHEDCLEIKYYWNYGKHYWNDLPCTYRKRFICERGLNRSPITDWSK